MHMCDWHLPQSAVSSRIPTETGGKGHPGDAAEKQPGSTYAGGGGGDAGALGCRFDGAYQSLIVVVSDQQSKANLHEDDFLCWEELGRSSQGTWERCR